MGKKALQKCLYFFNLNHGFFNFKWAEHGPDDGLEKIMVTECEYPQMIGTTLGCYKTLYSSYYTFTLSNNSPFDLEIPAIKFDKFDGEVVTEIDHTMDEGDLLPLVVYEVLILIAFVMIGGGFMLRFFRR